MNNQKGSGLVIALFFLAAIVLVGGLAVVSYISAANRGNQMEMGIKATWEDNENLLASYGLKVSEASQVPGMARDDISRVAREAIQGRYGADGSKAIFQAITEQNPQVDPVLYRNIQQIIESGRNQFQVGQTRLIDQKRLYETALGTVWGGMWMRMAGYPKLDLSKYKIITTDAASQAVSSGKDRAIELRPQVPSDK
jgi:hypothetical protein